jgi:hypothetical protein
VLLVVEYEEGPCIGLRFGDADVEVRVMVVKRDDTPEGQ